MITESLHQILQGYVNVDTDIGELEELLHSPEPPAWLGPFHDDLVAAIRSRSLTPTTAGSIMARNFQDQRSLDAWLQEAWAAWFPGEDYPG